MKAKELGIPVINEVELCYQLMRDDITLIGITGTNGKTTTTTLTYNILKEYKLRGSIHCYSGSVEMAREFTKLGYMIGVGGVVTYKNSRVLKEVVKDTDLSYILLETDSPFLTPEPHRKEKNQPMYIPLIANKIAEVKGISVEEVRDTSTSNASRLFDF